MKNGTRGRFSKIGPGFFVRILGSGLSDGIFEAGFYARIFPAVFCQMRIRGKKLAREGDAKKNRHAPVGRCGAFEILPRQTYGGRGKNPARGSVDGVRGILAALAMKAGSKFFPFWKSLDSIGLLDVLLW